MLRRFRLPESPPGFPRRSRPASNCNATVVGQPQPTKIRRYSSSRRRCSSSRLSPEQRLRTSTCCPHLNNCKKRPKPSGEHVKILRRHIIVPHDLSADVLECVPKIKSLLLATCM